MTLVQNHRQLLNGNNFRACTERSRSKGGNPVPKKLYFREKQNRMTKQLLIIILVFSFSVNALAQTFKKHTVKQGETIESITKQYLVSADDLYALNPDAKKKLEKGMVLVIPESKKNGVPGEETKELIGYSTHKVKRKETLFSLSREYKISIEDIKKHNKQLYTENLKKGDKIRIPKYKTIASQVTPSNTLKTYTVLPKEGKWRVAYKYGITVEELEALNPDMNEVLQPGDVINVPNIDVKDEKPVDDNYNYYTVLPKEGFYRLKVKLGLTQEQLEALNPELKGNELKAGMVLKVPLNTKVDSYEGAVQSTNLSSKLKNSKTKKLAVMLPFRLNIINVDSAAAAKDAIRRNKLLDISLDFHSGILMALDSAKQLGISTHLKVFDTQNQLSEVSSILAENDFTNYDAVIGPLMANTFDRVASTLKRDNVPVISPLVKPENLYSNVFQTIPSEDMLVDKMIRFVKNDASKSSVIIIADSKNKVVSDRIKSEIPNAHQVFSRKNKEGTRDANYINAADIQSLFGSGKNYVFLESANGGFVDNVTGILNSQASSKNIVLVTTNKTDAFDYKEVSNFHLAKLQFHYPSIHKSFDAKNPNSFVKRYTKTYGIEPNKYAIRGFDLTLDVLLRLASEDNLYKASGNDIETEYTENKFRYAKKLLGGYYNESVYIVKYNSDLIIEEAKQ